MEFSKFLPKLAVVLSTACVFFCFLICINPSLPVCPFFVYLNYISALLTVVVWARSKIFPKCYFCQVMFLARAMAYANYRFNVTWWLVLQWTWLTWVKPCNHYFTSNSIISKFVKFILKSSQNVSVYKWEKWHLQAFKVMNFTKFSILFHSAVNNKSARDVVITQWYYLF